MGIDRPIEHLRFAEAMEGVQQLIPAQHAPVRLDERREQAELGRGEGDRGARDRDFMAVEIHLQVAVAQNFPPARCKLVTAHWLKIFPPGQTAAQFLKYKAATCSNPSASVRTLAVQTVQPGQGVS